MPRYPRHTSGFTLVELIAVIAVMGVLVAVIIPAVGVTRTNSQRAQCTGNLRKIGGDLFLYAAENNNHIPPVAVSYPPPDQKQMWQYAIWTYLGYAPEAFDLPENDFAATRGRDNNIFHCPKTKRGPIAAPSVSSGVNGNKMSYGLNPLESGAGTVPIALHKIATPALTSMVNETSYCLGGYWGYYMYFGLLPHGEGTNVLFYDGHVEYRNFTSIPTDRNDSFWK